MSASSTPLAGLPAGRAGAVPELPGGYLRALLIYALALVALAMLLVVKHARIAFMQVLPMSVAALAASALTAAWLMHRRAPAPATVLAAAAVGSVASVLVLGAILLLQGKSASLVLNRGDVQHRLLAGPLLSGLFALGLVQLARSRERERLAWQQRAAAQLQAERLQRERVQAELQLLQAQLQPHFLYNTLANLRHLVRTDSARALEMLEHLIQYFKLALPSFRVEQVPLHDELALAHSYVALLRERVDQAIELEQDRAVELDRLLVPGGAVLCLLENAIKHGLPADPAAARRLRIRAERTAEGLRLTVSDNGPGLATTRGAGTESTGTGLTNLRERLALLHPQRARLRLVDRGDGCDAILDLPVVEP